MKRVLHIVGVKSTKFVKPFAQLLAKTGIPNQMFLPVGLEEQKADFYKDVQNCEMGVEYPRTYNPFAIIKFLYQFFGVLEKYDVLIWHSLFFQRIIFVLAYLFHKDIVRRSVWFVWGGDLYSWRTGNWLYDYCYKAFVRNLMAIMDYLPSEWELIRKEFGYSKEFYNWTYIDDVGDLINTFGKTTMHQEKINIMVGHSAAPENNHVESLRILRRFDNHNIHIYIPLSYGDMQYAKEVEQYAYNKFSRNNVTVLKDFMPKDEWYELLSRMDIVVLNAKRQIALTNTHVLMAMGKTIYLNREGVVYPYFKELGLSVYPVDEIEKLVTENLIKPVNKKTIEYGKSFFDIKRFERDAHVFLKAVGVE